jgi:hypothetical protein
MVKLCVMDKGKRVFLPWRCFFPFMNETAAPSFPSSFSRYRADVYMQERGADSSGRVDEEKRFPEETATAVPALPALS